MAQQNEISRNIGIFLLMERDHKWHRTNLESQIQFLRETCEELRFDARESTELLKQCNIRADNYRSDMKWYIREWKNQWYEICELKWKLQMIKQQMLSAERKYLNTSTLIRHLKTEIEALKQELAVAVRHQ